MLSKSLNIAVVALALVGGLGSSALANEPVSLELRAEASTMGSEVRLRQIARWPTKNNAFFASFADIVVARFEPGQLNLTLTLGELRTILEGAGMTGGEVSYRGPVSVQVRRLDTTAAANQKPYVAPPANLQEFLDQAEPATPNGVTPNTGEEPKLPGLSDQANESATLAHSKVEPLRAQATSTRTLREALKYDVINRLNLKPEDVEVTFETKDERVLNLTEPAYSWQISQARVRNLGATSWTVSLFKGDTTQRVTVLGRSRAWVKQLVLTKGAVNGQILRLEDFEEKRVLVDRLPDEQLLRAEQAQAMQVIRDLPAGTALTVRMVQPVLLVKNNQLVTITLQQGAFEVKSVGRAKESGGYGAVIRVENEATKQSLRATVIGPQEVRIGPANESNEENK